MSVTRVRQVEWVRQVRWVRGAFSPCEARSRRAQGSGGGAPRPLIKVRRIVVGALLTLSVPHAYIHAQPPSTGVFIAARGGTNLVGNTYRVRSAKPEPGGGVTAGTFLSRRWAVEFETWMRAANPECCAPRRREMLYSVSVIRPLTTTRLQPYMLGGLTLLRAANSDVQVQVGLGAQFVMHRRIWLAVDLRGNGGGSTMIVRPAASLMYFFR